MSKMENVRRRGKKDDGSTVKRVEEINPVGFDKFVSRTETKGSTPDEKDEKKED